MIFITELKSVYSAVRTGSLKKAGLRFVFQGLIKGLSLEIIVKRIVKISLWNLNCLETSDIYNCRRLHTYDIGWHRNSPCGNFERSRLFKLPTWCHLLFYFTSYVLNMFRALIYPSSGTCDCVVELPHRSIVLSSLCVGDLVRLGLSSARVAGWSTSCASARNSCGSLTTQSQAPDDAYINVRSMLST